MRLRQLIAPCASVASAIVACTVGEVDYTGKACPCPPIGYVCVNNACVQSSGGDSSTPVGNSLIQISNLRAEWTTPNVIRWVWQSSGKKDDFGRYELTITSDVPNVGGVKTWTVKDNAELGRFELPNPNGGIDPVVATMTDTHDPNATYSAVLVAYDSAGNSSTSNRAQATTGVKPTSELPLYAGTQTPNMWTLNMTFRSSGCGRTGGGCCELKPDTTSSCANSFDAGASCYVNMQLGFNSAVDSSTVTANSFQTNAYLEFYYRYDGSQPSYWSDMWLFLNGAAPCKNAQYCKVALAPWTVSNAASYRRMQVPLRALNYDFAKLPPPTAVDIQTGITEVGIGGSWSPGSTVDLDHLSIWH
jgi:hypothetical protein